MILLQALMVYVSLSGGVIDHAKAHDELEEVPITEAEVAGRFPQPTLTDRGIAAHDHLHVIEHGFAFISHRGV